MTSKTYVVTNAAGANLRQCPSTTYPTSTPVQTLACGDTVEVITDWEMLNSVGSETTYYPVLVDGAVLYCSAALLAEADGEDEVTEMSDFNCVDVSSYQGTIDWTKVKAAGVDYAILRSVTKDLNIDSQFETNYKNARAAGVKVGVYLYAYATDTDYADTEAAALVELLDGRALDLPVFYDMEASDLRTATASTVQAIANAFRDVVTAAGYDCGIYCDVNFYSTKSHFSGYDSSCEFWIASYGTNDGTQHTVPTIDHHLIAHQFSSKCSVSGISGNVDGSVWYGAAESSTTSSTTTSSSSSSTSSTTSTDSTQKTYVKKFQTWLNSNYSAGLTVDGIQGTKTKSGATKALQTELNTQFSAGLTVDGIFGSKTKAACVNVKKGASGNLTRTIQGLLYGYGYDPNGFDGIFGSGCQTAVKSYQSDNGLSVDGVVGKNTWTSMLAS